MISINEAPQKQERLAGVTAIAVAAGAYAACAIGFALLVLLQAVPLASGAWIIGGGLETLGPTVFFMLGAALAAASFGIFAQRNWGRWLAIAIALYGIVQTTPAISSAVGDGRIVAIAREGAQIIARTAAVWYLFQEDVRESFR